MKTYMYIVSYDLVWVWVKEKMTDWHETLLCEFLWLTGCTFDTHSSVWQISSLGFGIETALM